MKQTRLLFIDRDGTLIQEPEDEQIDSFEKLVFTKGVFRNLAFIAQHTDYELVMVSNQDGLGTDRNLETMEARYRRLQELVSEVNRKIRELNDSVRQGFKVGADTSRAESAISRLTEMRDKFNNADIGSKNAVAELVSEYKILKNEIGNAKSEQDKLKKMEIVEGVQ